MKKILFLLLLSLINFSYANKNCSNLTGFSEGDPFLDEGIIDFDSDLFDPGYRACVRNKLIDGNHYDLHGFAYNSNLGFLSFYSKRNPVGAYVNRGVNMNTRIEYNTSLFPEFDESGVLSSASLYGYAYSSGHGWLKFNCKKHPKLDFDEDICFKNKFSVQVDLNDFNFLDNTYGLEGYAFSENIGFINMNGVRIELPVNNLAFVPKLDFVKPIKDPFANGTPIYDLGIKFFIGNQDKTREFQNNGFDFCLVFKDERYLNEDDLPILDENIDCLGHDDSLGSGLNTYNRDAFTYDFNKNVFRLKPTKYISSYVPAAEGEFGLKYLNVLAFDNVFRHPIEADFSFDVPLSFVFNVGHLNGFNDCSEADFLRVLDFNLGRPNPFSLCMYYNKTPEMSDMTLFMDFESNVQDHYFDGLVYVPSVDPETGESIDSEVESLFIGRGQNFVSNLFFKLDSDYDLPKEISRYLLNFNVDYSFTFDGSDYDVSRSVFTLKDSERTDYTPLVSGELNTSFFRKIDDLTTIGSVEISNISLFNAFVNKMKFMHADSVCTLNNPCSDVSGGESDLLYLNRSSDFGGDSVRISELVNFVGNTVVLDGINLIVDQDLFEDDFIGLLVNNANVFIDNSVTDLKLGLSTNGFVYPFSDIDDLTYLSESDFLGYFDSLNEDHFNELYFKGLLESKNCFGCSVETPVVLPSGDLAENVYEALEAKIKDLIFLRRTPLEYKIREVVSGLFRYQNCETGLDSDLVNVRSLNSNRLCYVREIDGVPLRSSGFLPENDLKRSSVFEYSSIDLPYFENPGSL